MNWTEGTLFRHSRRSIRKPNADRQRQKEYFARAHARAVESGDPIRRAPNPPDHSSPASSRRSYSSQRSQGSRRSHDSHGSRRSGLSSSRRRPDEVLPQWAEDIRKRLAPTPVPSPNPFQSVSEFLAQRTDPAFEKIPENNVESQKQQTREGSGGRDLSRPARPAPLRTRRAFAARLPQLARNAAKKSAPSKPSMDEKLRRMHRLRRLRRTEQSQAKNCEKPLDEALVVSKADVVVPQPEPRQITRNLPPLAEHTSSTLHRLSPSLRRMVTFFPGR